MRVALLTAVLFAFTCASAIAGTVTTGQYQVINIPVPHSQVGVKNVWDDVSVVARFGNPGAPFNDTTTFPTTVHGFYHSKDLWMVRYAPNQSGMWRYAITITDRGSVTVIRDSFLCLPSKEQGFVRLDEDSKSWWYSGSGKPYYAVGFGDCMGATRDSILEFGGIDGGYRPPGFHVGIEWNLPYEQYLTAYGDVAGFNLYRYSDGNCAYSMVQTISTSGNVYDELHSRWTDTLFTALRKHGFRIYMTILNNSVGTSTDTAQMSSVKRYAQYCIDRFGSLVDFWELTNESSPDSSWIAQVASYISIHDPYSHLVSVSWEKPQHPAIQIVSPHWYGREAVTTSDQVTADQINQYATIKKPVIFGEQGEGQKWDSLSPIRVRGRLWSSLFNAGTLIFWNSSFAKDCACNQYLGWPERRSVRILQNFSRLLNSYNVKRTRATNGAFNIWGIQGLKFQAYYIRNDHDVFALNKDLTIPVTLAAGGTYIWYDVHTGDILQRSPILTTTTSVTAPPFQTDIAFVAGQLDDSIAIDRQFRLDVNPRTFEALGVPVNAQKFFTVTLSNTGNDTITLEQAFTSSPSAKLQLTAPNWIQAPKLSPGETMAVQVGYRMIDTGGTGATFSFKHSGSPAWENVALDITSIASAEVTQSSVIDAFSVAPNPADNLLLIRNVGESNYSLPYQIYSDNGQEIASGFVSNGVIDTHLIPSGSYLIRFHTSTGSFVTRRIIVLH